MILFSELHFADNCNNWLRPTFNKIAFNNLGSQTQLNKLDAIYKIGACVISGAHKTAHSALLLHDLQLEPLAYSTQHVSSLVTSIFAGNTHPTRNVNHYLMVQYPNGINPEFAKGRRTSVTLPQKFIILTDNDSSMEEEPLCKYLC